MPRKPMTEPFHTGVKMSNSGTTNNSERLMIYPDHSIKGPTSCIWLPRSSPTSVPLNEVTPRPGFCNILMTSADYTANTSKILRRSCGSTSKLVHQTRISGRPVMAGPPLECSESFKQYAILMSARVSLTNKVIFLTGSKRLWMLRGTTRCIYLLSDHFAPTFDR